MRTKIFRKTDIFDAVDCQWKNEFWAKKGTEGIGAASDHWPVWLSLEMERGEFEEVESEGSERETKKRRMA